jgi:myo-inositol 2-dehydrogenase/D-chiro-inositol 1-dehydrogenase
MEQYEMDTNRTIKFGIIGAGRIGKLHAENLVSHVSGVEVVAIADVDPKAAQETAARLKIPRTTTDYREILADQEIHAVAICSSTNTHAHLIQEAAAAGKHIFCEKPIDFDLHKIDAALGAVEAAGVNLQVGFNRRFDPNFHKVHEMVADGKIGQPHILRITSRDPAPPPIEYIQVSGGIFLDMTIHDFDMARFLMGSEVEEIFVAAGVLVDPQIGAAGDLDTAVITLRFENGALGTIDNSRQAVYGYDQRVEMFGSQGMVTVANNTPDSHVYYSVTGVTSAKPLYFFLERYTQSFIDEMQAFVNSVRNDTPTQVSGVDGRIPVVMGLAARKSYQEGRPIKLREIE